MTTIFVTSSGTEIGKTFVCCRLIEELAGTESLRVIKPVATGYDPDSLGSTDTGRLLRAQGLPVDATQARNVTPWTYSAPLSPDRAAALESKTVPFDAVVEFSAPSSAARLTLIEGIGGLMVPMDATHTVLDWIDSLNPTVWLVVGSYLGTLSHTLTALTVLKQRRLTVGAVIVCESAEDSVGLDDTRWSLQQFSGDTPIVCLMRPPPPVAETKLLTPLLELA